MEVSDLRVHRSARGDGQIRALTWPGRAQAASRGIMVMWSGLVAASQITTTTASRGGETGFTRQVHMQAQANSQV
eukprot:3187702-Pleurochrysis_carterae.AAC.1